MGSGWVLGKDGLARAAFEHSESWIFHIGHLHRTIFWDMVRFIMGNAVRCGIACMEIEHLASSTEENLMNEFYEFDGVDGEEERAEFLKNHIKKARSQCWMKDWWWKAIKEIWSFHDKDLAMSRLPKRIHKRTERLIRMLEDYDLRITMNNLDAKCSEFFANEDYMHESCCAQIVWGQDDSILLEELDHWVDSIYSGMSIYSHVELCRPDAEKVMVTESTIDQLKERERIRKEIALWLREATRIQRSRSASRRARSSTRGRRPNQG